MAQPDATRRYAIRGGNEGKERLDVLARVLLPTTTQLLVMLSEALQRNPKHAARVKTSPVFA